MNRFNPINKRHLIFFVLIPLLYFPCYISNDLLLELTKEDGVYEYVGAFLFLFTAIAFFILARKPKLYDITRNNEKYPKRIYFWLFALLFFFAFGEEISWGQRIFNFETPQAIKEINIQEEFNLHNLEFFHGKTTEGEEKTGIMALFTMHRLFYMGFLTYLLILPLLYAVNSKVRVIIDRFRLPIPHILIGVLFAFNLAYGNVLRALASGLDGHGTVEIKEVVVAFVLFALPLSWMGFKKA